MAAILGIVIAAYRRYIQRPDRLDNKTDDAITLGLIFIILLTDFLIEGARIAAAPLKGLGVKTFTEDPAAEYLYWPGCSGAFDARNQKVSRKYATGRFI